MSPRHRFSFIVSNYNYEQYLDQCLLSLRNQSYDPNLFEIVVVDDGSTDGSGEVIRRHKQGFKNFVAVFIENSGLEKAVNTGIRAAHSDHIIRVDADDFLDPQLLRRMDEAMTAQPDYDFYYCGDYVEYYDEADRTAKKLPSFDAEEVFERGDFFATGTVYRKSDLESIGLFPEDVKNCGLENYSVVLALLSRGKRGLAVPGASFSYRRHRTNMSTVKRAAIIDYGRQLLHRYGRTYKTNQFHPYGLRLDDPASESRDAVRTKETR